MAAILNAIFGMYSGSEQPKSEVDQNQTVVAQSTASNEVLHTSAVADDVQVKSTISSETQANASINTKLNIDALLAQLGTTYTQVDQYSQTRTAEINEQVQKSIAAVLETTRRQQEELLKDANRRHLVIDNEYKVELQKAVEVLDAVKAKALAHLERELQVKQQLIMSEAKKDIDVLNDQANAAKLTVLVEAQEQAKQNIDDLANQVVALGQHETENVLQSTTTTIITSQAHAAETVVTNEQPMTATAENQMQVALRSPSELVPFPGTTTTNSTVTEVVAVVSEPAATSVSVEATTTSSAVTTDVETS